MPVILIIAFGIYDACHNAREKETIAPFAKAEGKDGRLEREVVTIIDIMGKKIIFE